MAILSRPVELLPRLEIDCNRNICSQQIEVYIFDRNTRSVGVPFIMVKVPEGEPISHPTLSLCYGDAQQLMDSLFREGVRPIDYRDESSQVEALKAHIKDLQGILQIFLNKLSKE